MKTDVNYNKQKSTIQCINILIIAIVFYAALFANPSSSRADENNSNLTATATPEGKIIVKRSWTEYRSGTKTTYSRPKDQNPPIKLKPVSQIGRLNKSTTMPPQVVVPVRQVGGSLCTIRSSGGSMIACIDKPLESARHSAYKPAPPTPTQTNTEPNVISFTQIGTENLDKAGLAMNPPINNLIINMDNNFYVTNPTQTKTVNVQDTPIQINLHATKFLWDWGDGQQTETTDPGAPWPEGKIIHQYSQVGQYQVTLTTTWEGTYTTPNRQTRPITGQGQTTETSRQFQVNRLIGYLIHDQNHTPGTR